ncbi:hypothetical protein JGU71_10270 [Antrihabitans sp. YC3-6]|uniref:Uncharacterized protein n=1 Tax=Antrihabitans stalagmiti TaxID=2799499 RepID=A0A934NQ40_9NOCA|nr:hypothetical protein [Antrihabitans stalagmiti]MBJ8339274.1 hypothetical protein [Antrihabitans stalagmiti]
MCIRELYLDGNSIAGRNITATTTAGSAVGLVPDAALCSVSDTVTAAVRVSVTTQVTTFPLAVAASDHAAFAQREMGGDVVVI